MMTEEDVRILRAKMWTRIKWTKINPWEHNRDTLRDITLLDIILGEYNSYSYINLYSIIDYENIT